VREFPFPSLLIYFSVASRRSNAFNLPRKQNAKHARRLKFHVVSVTGRGTLLNVVVPSPVRMQDLVIIIMNRGKPQHAAIDSFLFYNQYPRSESNPALDAFAVSSGSSSPSISSHSNSRSTSHSPKASGIAAADGESHGRYQSYPPDPRRPTDPSHR